MSTTSHILPQTDFRDHYATQDCWCCPTAGESKRVTTKTRDFGLVPSWNHHAADPKAGPWLIILNDNGRMFAMRPPAK